MRNSFFLIFVFLLLACRKEQGTTDPLFLLSLSTDTLRFDTVFTTTGTATYQFKIFNTHNKGIQVASIRLQGGTASPFNINVNGQPGPNIENLEIPANDSIYVFVTARIEPTNTTTPFIVQDSIELLYNGNKKQVQLEAYGQNAHFIRNGKIKASETWTADLPYVLLGAFHIEKEGHLIIEAGCKIYAHANAPVVVSGQLTVQGKKGNIGNVLFTGDRLDEPYRTLPGSWPGIIFTSESHNNRLQYLVIKNAYQGIVVEASPIASKLILQQTIIDNAYDAGFLATNASVTAENILISNCGKNLVLQGGTYRFTHATIAAFSTTYLPHKTPLLTISNGTATTDLNAVFRNCIFWGESGGVVPDEIVINKTGTAAVNLLFDGVLWPLASPPEGAAVPQTPVTTHPEFALIGLEDKLYDFHLKETSPAIRSGVPSGLSLDLDGQPRPATAPDLGAYQKQ